MYFRTSSICLLLTFLTFLHSANLFTIQFAYNNILRIPPTLKPSTEDPHKIRTTETFENSSENLDDHVINLNSQSDPEQEIGNILCKDERNSSEEEDTTVRYDLNAGVCAKIGKQEHCGRNMVFKEEIDSFAYGFCDCDFEGKQSPLVYHPKSDSCYFVYTQAYCSEGEWLAFSRKEKKALCEPNKCGHTVMITRSRSRKGGARPTQKELARSKQHSESPLWVPLNGNGTCVKLNTAADNCDNDEVVVFSRYDVVPHCALPETSLWRRNDILPNPCPIGSYYSIIGRCQPDWDF